MEKEHPSVRLAMILFRQADERDSHVSAWILSGIKRCLSAYPEIGGQELLWILEAAMADTTASVDDYLTGRTRWSNKPRLRVVDCGDGASSGHSTDHRDG